MSSKHVVFSSNAARAGLALLAAFSAAACEPDSTPSADDAGKAPAIDASVTEAFDVTSEPSLVEAHDFKHYDADEDPLRAHQPAKIECGVAGIYVERDVLEVDTGYCNYMLAAAPSRLAVDAGTKIDLELRHFDLAAPEPATAHIAIFFGDELQWETTIDVPHAAEVLTPSFEATRAFPAGTAVRLHLHNHGQNHWALSHMRVRQ